jgi:hypothetical protein
MTELKTELIETDAGLRLRVSEPQEHRTLDGSRTMKAPVEIADVDLPAETDVAEALADKLASWAAKEALYDEPSDERMYERDRR